MKAYFQKYQQGLLIHLATSSNGSAVFDKANMLNLSPYNEAVFLDADSIVLKCLVLDLQKPPNSVLIFLFVSGPKPADMNS